MPLKQALFPAPPAPIVHITRQWQRKVKPVRTCRHETAGLSLDRLVSVAGISRYLCILGWLARCSRTITYDGICLGQLQQLGQRECQLSGLENDDASMGHALESR